MKQFSILFKTLLQNTYSPSPTGGQQPESASKKKVGKAVLYVLLAVYLMVLAYIYFYNMAGLLAASGRLDSFVALAFAIAAVVSFGLTLLHSQGYIYGCRDFEMLSALPVSQRTIFLSKFALLYLEVTVISLVASIPCFLCYALFANPPFWFYIVVLIMIFFAPAVGVVVGGILAYLTTLVTIGVGAKNKLMLVFNFALVLSIMYFSMKWSLSLSQTGALEAMAQKLADIAAINPLAPLITAAAVKGSLPALLLYILLCLALMGAAVLVIGSGFHAANARMGETRRRGDFKGERLHVSTQLKALYKKEMSAYFSQYIYVMNTAFGFVLMIIGSGVLLFKGGALKQLFAGLPGGQQTLFGALIVFVTFCTTLSSTTSCSISMEGSSFWVVRSLPVTAKALLGSKMLVWLTVSVPATLFSIIAASLILGLPAVSVAALCLYAVACCAACGIWGLAIDLANPKLNWTSAVTVVKQSSAVLFAMLIGMTLSGISAVAVLVLNLPALTALGGLTLILAGFSAGAWQIMLKRTDRKLLQIEG